jgi:beta-lactam-binding protein with PASTA domain
MATRVDLPPDVAAALDRAPEARARFEAMPPDRRAQWVDWIDRADGRRREARIDEAVRRLQPAAGGTAATEEVVEPAAPPPERNWWIWLVLLLLLVVGGLLAWFFLTRGSDKTTVPRVVGLQESAATQRLQAKHLKVLPNTAPSSRPLGVVFAQRPGAGAQVKKGQTVAISVSGGPARLAVPNVTSVPLKQAQQKLTAAGFKSSVKRVASTRPKDVVTDQAPVAGVTAVKGTTVVLSVSNGLKPVVVPSLVGQTQGAAVSQLTKLGLKPQLQNVSSGQPAGLVVAQKPPAGKEVDKGSTVVLNVSRGAAGGTTTVQTTTTTTTSAATGTPSARAVRVPSVRSLAFTAGLRRLNTAGFRPVVRYVSSTQPAGRIVAASPSGGTLPRGSRVRVSVSNGPNPAAATTVPNVVGQDQAAAANALRQAGFKVLVLFRKTTDSSKDGMVLDEQPVAGSSIPRGSYVAIFVGRTG